MQTINDMFKQVLSDKQLIQEMPWVAGVKCPKCDNAFEADVQMEKWPIPTEDRKECMNEYYKYKMLPFVCPECSEELIYDLAKKKTFSLNRILHKLKPSVRKYIEKVKELVMPNSRIETALTDSLTFKSFSDTLDVLEEDGMDQQFETANKKLIGIWILPSGKQVEVGFTGHYNYVKRNPEAFGYDPDDFEGTVQHTQVINAAYVKGAVHIFIDPNHAMEAEALNEPIIKKQILEILKLQKKYGIPEEKVNISVQKPIYDIMKLSQFIG